ncbi:site-specific integrase [Azospirillum sp. TSA2s]|uniref:site-specific integrase n=1 Tax=Azospirillum sp. TSA2s TaxID=709810 RepID=UPI0010AA922C|nr:site-specific integrase [Azospirillum sp. TSA2s]QCG98115.1 site-specific integrase [Azospirillum sp. TSA2s]
MDALQASNEVANSDARPALTRASEWGSWIDCDSLMPPPFGGPAPSYIANTYDEDVWIGLTINPATGYPESINFANVPPAFRWYAKWYLWAAEYTSVGRTSKAAKSFGSARTLFSKMRHFLCFVHGAGHTRLDTVPSEVLIAAAQDYLRHPVHNAASKREDRFGRTAVRRRSSKTKSETKNRISMEQYLWMIDRAYRLGPGECGYIPDGPLSDTSDAAVTILSAASKITGTKEIPEPIAHALLNTAIVWIEELAPVIERLLEKNADPENLSSSEDLRKALGFIQDADTFFCSSKRPDVYRRWYQTYLETGDLGQLASTPTPVNRFKDLLTAACYIVIAGFSGFRADEILGLKDGWIDRKGNRAFIKADIIKITETGKYQANRPAPLVCHTAGNVLKILSVTYRDRHDGRLFVTNRGAVFSSNTINWTIQDFADVTGVPKFDFKSHQFRRFFALFYVRRFKGSLDALRRHFRHVSREMIFAYMGDAGNADYMIKDEQDLAREIAHSLITGDGKYASRQVGQREMKAMAKYKAQNLPPEEIEKRIQALIEKSYVQVTANEWGYCLPQKHDFIGSACGSKDGLPNHANAAPGTCGTCRFMAVGHEHREWWEHTILVHQEILDHELSLRRLKEASQGMIEIANRVMATLELNASDKDLIAHA